MDITSSFLEGLNQDRSFSKGNNKSSYYSLDIDIITNIGESTGIISNTKGNQLSFNVPNTQKVYIIELDGTGSPTVLINGIGPLILSITPQTTILDVYNEIISSYASYIAAGDYGVYYNNSQIYIVGFNTALTVATAGAGVTSSLQVSAQSNLSIIGWGLLGEEIIIVTTSKANISTIPTNTVGQVWRIPYDDATNTINNLSGSSLDPQYHLVYNNILDLSLANEIYRELIGRVESSTKGSIYWLNDYNIPRALNIYNPQSLAIPPGLLGFKPDINTTTPLINGILNGGSTKVGTYFFSYQLYTQDGAITPFSPMSLGISLTNEPFNTSNYFKLDGAEAGTVAGKSIRVKIPYIDRQYDFIKIAVIQYELENVPNIFTFIDQPITDDIMEFIYTGNENQVSVTLSEFLNPQINFDKAKTFTQKKNRLYIGNTSTTNFDINWDARVYRFNSSSECKLYSRNNTTATTYVPADLTSPTGALYLLPDTADAVNPYNDESGQVFGLIPTGDYTVDWLTVPYQCKYKSDGSTLGGSGVNISYSFFLKDYIGDSNVNTIPTYSPFINVTASNSGSATQAIYSPAISELEPSTQGWDAIKNPFYNMIFPSYSRGEVYRFGITFYNTKGQQSFVKWIADIRIPEPWEDSDFDLSSEAGGELTLKAIGINFSIDTSTLPSDITGFRIVRCNRSDDDKTRFGIGLTSGLWSWAIQYADLPSGTTTNSWLLGRKRNPAGVAPIFQNSFSLDLNVNFRNSESDKLGVIKFPDFDFNKYQNGQASHIKRIANYTITNDLTGVASVIQPSNVYWASDSNSLGVWMQAVLAKANTVNSRSSNIVNIDSQIGIGIDGQVLSTFSPDMLGLDYNHTLIYYNEPPGTPDDEVCSLGSKMLFVDYHSSMENFSGTATNEFQIISLCRFNQGQYGGPWRSARYNNIYQSCSDFLPKNEYDSASQDIIVFGGDTYVNYYNTTFSFFHWGETYGVAEATPSGLASNYYPLAATQLAIAVSFPTECSINTDLRYGKYFNKDQVNQFVAGAPNPAVNQSLVFAKFLSDDYLFNDSFAQENNLLSYLPKPFLVQTNQENKGRVWYTNEKFDREIIDSWRLVGVNNYVDLEGIYGSLNKLSNLNETLYGHQERAITRISSEELSTVANTDGLVMQAGTGNILARYDYLSKETGVYHQHSVVTTPSSIYHYDSRLNKIFKIGQGLEPLTDIKGLSAFFRANIIGNTKTSDQVLLNKGVHGVYDSMYNKVYFTFERTEEFTYNSVTTTSGLSPTTVYTGDFMYLVPIYNIGQYIYVNNTAYEILYISNSELILNGNSIITRLSTIKIAFTIAYNEILDSFESFYSFTPCMYLGTGKRLFSTNPYDIQNSVYQHNIGNFGEFYDKNPSTSILQFIVNYPDATKLPTFRYDILQYWSEVTDNLNQDYTLESITGLLIENDYQTTGNSLIPLTLGSPGNYGNVRYERTWRIDQIFDNTDPNKLLKPYLRDKYSKITVFYDNSLNRYLRLHDITSTITIS